MTNEQTIALTDLGQAFKAFEAQMITVDVLIEEIKKAAEILNTQPPLPEV